MIFSYSLIKDGVEVKFISLYISKQSNHSRKNTRIKKLSNISLYCHPQHCHLCFWPLKCQEKIKPKLNKVVEVEAGWWRWTQIPVRLSFIWSLFLCGYFCPTYMTRNTKRISPSHAKLGFWSQISNSNTWKQKQFWIW